MLRRFLTARTGPLEPADGGVLVQGAVVDAGDDGRATAIATFSIEG